ncbi:hypothetical protein D6D20_01259 [Aureobasidium pullulans]|uniref:Uncharacterized protein n=1 Tax=Aureobasidium pullulans TaxID=5580 RepID=A0A4S8ZK62_AURPU|nr:hypothetical protein D6D20_01259 [Aureobasidium pullulans]
MHVSAEVISKARVAHFRERATDMIDAFDISTRSSSPYSSDSCSSAGHSPLTMTSYVSPPSVDSDDQSFAFFFNNWVINNGMYHNFVHEPGNKHLIASIKAFSIASLSKNSSDRRLLTLAQYQYTTALNLTNTALRNPAQVLRDETLLAILVLTNYETLTGGVERNLSAWEQHINGSASLLGLRGLEGVRGKAGRVLTLHVITGINVVCLLRCLPTPPVVHLLQAKIFEFLYEPDNPVIRFQRLNLDCADFRHAVTCGLITSPEAIIARAAELDLRLTTAFAGVPQGWDPEIIAHSVKRHHVQAGLPGFELRYADQAINYIWASYRSSRIMVNEIVLQSIERDTHVHRSAWGHSHTIVRQCQTEILASMPQYTSQSGEQLPWSGFKRPVRYFVPEAVSSSLPIMRALSGYGVLWPLFVAGTCSTTTSEIRNYVADVYGYFGEQLKIEQALVLRQMIWSLSGATSDPRPGSGSVLKNNTVHGEYNK